MALLYPTIASRMIRILQGIRQRKSEFHVGYSCSTGKLSLFLFLDDSDVFFTISLQPNSAEWSCTFPPQDQDGSWVERKRIPATVFLELVHRFQEGSTIAILFDATAREGSCDSNDDIVSLSLPSKFLFSSDEENTHRSFFSVSQPPMATVDFQSFSNQMVEMAESTTNNTESLKLKKVYLTAERVSRNLGICNLRVQERRSKYSLRARVGFRMIPPFPPGLEFTLYSLLQLGRWAELYGAQEVSIIPIHYGCGYKVEAVAVQEQLMPLQVSIEMT